MRMGKSEREREVSGITLAAAGVKVPGVLSNTISGSGTSGRSNHALLRNGAPPTILISDALKAARHIAGYKRGKKKKKKKKKISATNLTPKISSIVSQDPPLFSWERERERSQNGKEEEEEEEEEEENFIS